MEIILDTASQRQTYIKFIIKSDKAAGKCVIEYINDKWQIELIQVSPIRKGYGNLLLQHVLQYFKAKKINYVITHPTTPEAIKLFKRNGFEKNFGTDLFYINLIPMSLHFEFLPDELNFILLENTNSLEDLISLYSISIFKNIIDSIYNYYPYNYLKTLIMDPNIDRIYNILIYYKARENIYKIKDLLKKYENRYISIFMSVSILRILIDYFRNTSDMMESWLLESNAGLLLISTTGEFLKLSLNHPYSIQSIIKKDIAPEFLMKLLVFHTVHDNTRNFDGLIRS
jgi:hypothetical protein